MQDTLVNVTLVLYMYENVTGSRRLDYMHVLVETDFMSQSFLTSHSKIFYKTMFNSIIKILE